MVCRWKGFKDHWQVITARTRAWPEGPSHVGFLGRTGNLMLDARFTEFDPGPDTSQLIFSPPPKRCKRPTMTVYRGPWKFA